MNHVKMRWLTHTVAEQRGRDGGGNFAHKCIFTTPIADRGPHIYLAPGGNVPCSAHNVLICLLACTLTCGRKKMFYLTTHSTHFIYGYMASDIWLRTILIVRKETRCRHIGYSYRLTARVLLYAPSQTG